MDWRGSSVQEVTGCRRGSSVQEVTGCSRGSSRGSLPVPIPPASGQELARAKRKLLFKSNVFQGKDPDHVNTLKKSR